jgi:diamine N-acetyltransferase
MITYRDMVEADIPAQAELGGSTFVETFGRLYSEKDLNAFLDKVFSLTGVRSDWSDPNQVYHLAEEDGRLVGYCKLGLKSSLDFDAGDRRVVEIKQFYVRNSHHGRGIAQELMAWALAKAKEHYADDIVLSVWTENERAKRFYERYGFRFVKDIIFMVGEQADHDLLYHLDLRD